MSIETWGTMPKSQDDGEVIADAIAAAIAAHEADPEAHLSESGSLQSHKASEVIDHLAESIIADKVADFQVLFQHQQVFSRDFLDISLESTEFWDGSGGTIGTLGALLIQTSNVNNTTSYYFPYTNVAPVWNKDFIWQTTIQFSATTNQTAYVICGTSDPLDTQAQFVGFKVVNGTLYAAYSKSNGSSPTEYLTAISGITITAKHFYRVNFYAGDRIEFYIDNILVHTATTNLPSATYPGDFLYLAQIKNSAAANKVIYGGPIHFEQDK